MKRSDSLHALVQKGDLAGVEKLLRQGAEVDAVDGAGHTPLMLAVRSNLAGVDMLQLLVRYGRTAFLLAVQRGSQEKAHACLAAGADLEERDSRGKTALMHAAARDDDRLAAWLLELSAMVNAVDKEGYTALMDACIHDARNTARLLLAAGADITMENNYGEAAVKLAVSPTTVHLLIEYGADWNDADTEQRRALAGLPVDYDPLVSPKEYTGGKHRRYGRRNPEVIDIPFWREMVKSGVNATRARMLYRDGAWGMPRSGKAVWCYERFGQSITLLSDDRIIMIGGEHEDAYDPEFCIYNDVVVFDGEGEFTIYGYPEAVFPPTDFHSATLVGAYIYLIGSLGYHSERHYGDTPVYCLDTNSFVMQRMHTTGDKPGWISRHRAKLVGDRSIRIAGGKVCRLEEDMEEYLENTAIFVLDLEQMKWRRETGSY